MRQLVLVLAIGAFSATGAFAEVLPAPDATPTDAGPPKDVATLRALVSDDMAAVRRRLRVPYVMVSGNWALIGFIDGEAGGENLYRHMAARDGIGPGGTWVCVAGGGGAFDASLLSKAGVRQADVRNFMRTRNKDQGPPALVSALRKGRKGPTNVVLVRARNNWAIVDLYGSVGAMQELYQRTSGRWVIRTVVDRTALNRNDLKFYGVPAATADALLADD